MTHARTKKHIHNQIIARDRESEVVAFDGRSVLGFPF